MNASTPTERGLFDWRRFSGEAALVIGGAAIGNIFSYVFHFVLSRRLGPANYGTLVTLMAIAGMLSVIGLSLGTVAMQETAKLWTAHADRAIAPFVRSAGRFVFIIALLCAVGLVLVSWPLGAYVHVTQQLLWVLLALYVAIGMFAGFVRGAAQGAHRFGIFAASFVSEGAVKVLVALWLVALGFGVAGALGGLIASALVAVAVATLALTMHAGRAGLGEGERLRLGGAALRVFAVTAASNVLLFIDMLFAKHHFSGETAGWFGAAGTVARTLPFGVGFVALILMPKAAAAWHTSRDSLGRVLLAAGAIAAIGIAAGFALITLLPAPIINITYGPSFAGAVPLLRFYAIDEALFAFWSIALAYLIAVARYEVFAVLVGAAVVEAVAMALLGSTPTRLLTIAIIANAALVPLIWGLALQTLRALPQASAPYSAETAL
jgi:O-antigen/teichoic acid export membrane protein